MPALFALVIALVSGINATAIIYVGIAPILWILYAVVVLREATWRQAVLAALRIGVLSLFACLWWVAGLMVEAGYGVNVLKYTETVPSTSATSNASEVLRGLGYWYFYGSDHLGPWAQAAVRFTQDIWLLVTSYAVPVLAVVAAAFLRWRERSYFILLVVVGMVLSVGPFPYSDPTAVGGRAQGLHDRHHGRPGPALDRSGHAGGPPGPGHAPRQRGHRAVPPFHAGGAGDRGPDRGAGDRQQPVAVQRRHHRQQLHPAGKTSRRIRCRRSTI